MSPHWVHSREVNDSDARVRAIISCLAICSAFAYVAVIARFTARLVAHIRIGVDDWMICASLVCLVFRQNDDQSSNRHTDMLYWLPRRKRAINTVGLRTNHDHKC